MLANEEIRTIISALGAGVGNDFNLEKLNYHKVIILSDADQDGFHIRCILLTFFFRYMRPLVNAGHVYIGMPPLYKVYKQNGSAPMTTRSSRRRSKRWAGGISSSATRDWAR